MGPRYMRCLSPASAVSAQIWTCYLSQEHPDCERVPVEPASRADRPQGVLSQTMLELCYEKS